MLKTQYVPFCLDNNSSNLPFCTLKDNRANDIIYINNNNLIYTNSRNTKLNEQIHLYSHYFDAGISFVYKINDDLSLLKSTHNKETIWTFLNDNEKIELHRKYFDNLSNTQIHFNDKYVCLANFEYGSSVPEVVAAYDIEKNALLDCSDYNTKNELYKNIVEARNFDKNVILSILNGKNMCKEKDLENALSFLLNKEVNDKNLEDALAEALQYIKLEYEKLNNLDLTPDLDILSRLYFKRKPKEIDIKKEKQNKVYAKTR